MHSLPIGWEWIFQLIQVLQMLQTSIDFYSNTHRPEVLAGNPGFLRGRRYELAQDDPRGPRGPRFLAAYDIESEEAALLYISRNDGPASGRPVYSDGPSAWQKRQTKWRLMWQTFIE
jgi:hypothetical protein